MAVTAIGTIRQNLAVEASNKSKGSLDGPGQYASINNNFASLGDGVYLIELPTFDSGAGTSNAIAIFFFGKPGMEGTPPTSGTCGIWGLKPSGTTDEYVGVFLGAIGLEVGGAVSAAGPIPMNSKAVDAISVTTDFSLTPPGMRTMGAADGGLAVLVVDCTGFSHIIAQTTQTGGTGTDPQINLGWWPL